MSEGHEDCIFCAIVSGEASAEIVDSDEHTVTMMESTPPRRGTRW